MRSLTPRGTALACLGAIALCAGWALGEPSGIAVGALLVLLPLLGSVSVHRSRFVIGSARVVSPVQFPVGSQAEVVLTVENDSRWASGVLLLVDTVTPNLSEPGRLLLDRIPPRAQRAERYRVTGRERGRARVGPLSVTVTDPFGMASVTRLFTTTTPLVVTPVIVPLGRVGASLSPGGRGDALYRTVAARGDDDVLPREHRAGDDMRRIHWRATARYGELMVRREEQAWHSSMVVILDNRVSAHTGQGPASTFEWAVSAAASIAVHYVALRWHVTVVTAVGTVLCEANAGAAGESDRLLQAFADVRPGPEEMTPAFGVDLEGASAVIAVLGRMTDEAARALVRPASGFAGCLPLEPAPSDHLRAMGWRVSPWTRGMALAEAWGRIAPTHVAAGR